jgi:23S rRNA G2445 N2-methylase RlmL
LINYSIEVAKALIGQPTSAKPTAFPIQASAAKSTLHSEPAIQSIVKKSIVKNLQKAYGQENLP